MLRRLGSLAVGSAALGLASLGACAKANLPDEEVDPLTLPDRVAGDDGTTGDGAAEDTFVPPGDGGSDGDGGATGPKVFVSSTTHNARYGGQAGATTICNDLAKAAGLTGTFVAWLSNKDGPNAAQRITAPGPWVLVGSGDLVASTKAELTGGTLKHAIDRDEKGAAVAASKVWTGTGGNGLYETNDCDAWTTGNNGRSGSSAQSNVQWTSATVDDCDALHRVYCFQN